MKNNFLIFCISVVLLTSCEGTPEQIYYKDPRTNVCFTAYTYMNVTKDDLRSFEYKYLYSITTVKCEDVPTELLINQLPK